MLSAFATSFTWVYPAIGRLLLVYPGVVPTAVVYGVFFAGMRHTPATTASVVTLLEPLTSTVLAWLFFGERFGAWGLFGMLLLCSAIGLFYRCDSGRVARWARAHPAPSERSRPVSPHSAQA
jgi:DME family drug/metabolite transporter